jgi:glycosyltransferase involved in cell wall biosynthesis
MIYAPIDLAVAIAKGLSKRGHIITIYGPNGTEVHGENISVRTMNLRAFAHDQAEFNKFLSNIDDLVHDVPGLWDRYMVSDMYARAKKGEFDLLHFHHPESALSTAAEQIKVPTVYTIHDPISSISRELFELFASKNQKFVSISNNQRQDAPDLPYLETVYNGTDLDLFSFSSEPEDFLLFTGRITPEKGVKEAIKVAKDSNHRLLIIGPVHHNAKDYFDQYIKPELNDRILYLGRMDQDQLPRYYQKAKAVLTPVQWEEPFGLTTIEAMACGAPVISLRRGAAPEIIVHGKTGFIVDSLAEMVEAVDKVGQIKRSDCRNHVAKQFTIEKMVDGYEKAFQKMIDFEDIPPATPKKRIERGIKKVRKALPKLTRER